VWWRAPAPALPADTSSAFWEECVCVCVCVCERDRASSAPRYRDVHQKNKLVKRLKYASYIWPSTNLDLKYLM
jgi:hypothetical protein